MATDLQNSSAQPQHKALPVAWRTFDGEGGYEYRSYDMNETYAEDWVKRNPNHKGWVEPLYASLPAQRKPLADEVIGRAFHAHNEHYALLPRKQAFKAGVRFAETAHDIEENQ